jgi:hypothetical protein
MTLNALRGVEINMPSHHEGPPRWVKVLGAVAVLLVIAFALLHLGGLSPMSHGVAK